MKTAILWIFAGIVLTVSAQYTYRIFYPIEESGSNKDAFLQINPPLRAGSSGQMFVFHKAAVFNFRSENETDKNNLENCLVMREWNTNKAYYSCGKKGEKAFYLEGKYYNNTAYPVFVHAGNFRIPLAIGKYLNQNFTTQDAVKIESGVDYTFRVVFEDFEQVPDVFEIEYGDFETYNHSLKVDLRNNTVTRFR